MSILLEEAFAHIIRFQIKRISQVMLSIKEFINKKGMYTTIYFSFAPKFSFRYFWRFFIFYKAPHIKKPLIIKDFFTLFFVFFNFFIHKSHIIKSRNFIYYILCNFALSLQPHFTFRHT